MPTLEDIAYDAPIISFLTTGVPVVKLNDSVGDAVDKYQLNPSSRSVLVVNNDGKLAGLLTENDMVTQLVDRNRTDPVNVLIKSPEVVAVRDSANLRELLRIMNGVNPTGHNLDIVPVVDRDTRPVGVIKRAALTAQLDQQLSRQFRPLA
jgi:CBS domain-containing protein